MANVLITGTSTGIGEASARLLAEHGWTVYAGVRRTEDGDRLKSELTGDVRPVILDVGKPEDIERVIADITFDTGTAGLQGLVNNAGVGVGGPFEYLTEADWRWVFDINFFGLVALTTAALPLLRDGRGRIVHIGSIGGRVASPGLGPYSASKHALEALAESQRAEFAGSGSPIRVSLIEPGEVKTAIWDKGDASTDEVEQKLDDDGRQGRRPPADASPGPGPRRGRPVRNEAVGGSRPQAARRGIAQPQGSELPSFRRLEEGDLAGGGARWT